MTYSYPAMVAYDPASDTIAQGVQFKVYATTDTLFTTPLAITTSTGGAFSPANTLTSNSKGVIPPFQQATYATVVVSNVGTHAYNWTILAVQPPTQDSTVQGYVNTPTSATAAALRTNFLGTFQPSTSYAQNQCIVNPSGDIVFATVAFTSTGSYNQANWSYSPTYVKASTRGAANGVATLDSNGLVPVAQLPSSSASFGYLYAGFTLDTYCERLNLAESSDGYTFVSALSNPVYSDPNTGTSLRDPSILKIGSTWFCAYTVNNGINKNFGVMKSTDLLNWTSLTGVANTPTLIDTSAATNMNKCWAPELIQDPATGTVYAFWTDQVSTGNNTIWYTQFTDNVGLTTWNAPAALTWTTAPNYAIWDGTFVWDANASTWRMFYANANNYPERASSTTITGPYTTDRTGDWANWIYTSPYASTAGAEGPELVHVNGTWRIYMDAYSGTVQAPTGTLSASSAVGATSISSSVAFNPGSTIQIDTGSNAEVVVTTGVATGTGPYTIPVPALHKAHNSGVQVTALGTPWIPDGYMYSESSDLNTWTACKATVPMGFPAGQVLRHGAFVAITSQADRNTVVDAINCRPKPRHAEYTASASIPSGTETYCGTITLDSTHSLNYSADLAIYANGQLQVLTTGFYDFTFHPGYDSNNFGNGTTAHWTSIYNDTQGRVLARAVAAGGYENSVEISSHYAQAGDLIGFKVAQFSGAAQTIDCRIFATRRPS